MKKIYERASTLLYPSKMLPVWNKCRRGLGLRIFCTLRLPRIAEGSRTFWVFHFHLEYSPFLIMNRILIFKCWGIKGLVFRNYFYLLPFRRQWYIRTQASKMILCMFNIFIYFILVSTWKGITSQLPSTPLSNFSQQVKNKSSRIQGR